ncbi:MAG: prepilin-type N-terminal cleavage/methylation domain-containing protein [Acidobacteriota bacterium]|nr:prepilin-type N-terminal cleavage/methylation domain-containing protein [Acidobacteriota bacterium]
MKSHHSERGVSLVEAMVSLVLILLIMSAFGGFMVQSAKINKSRLMAVETQATARNTLSLVVQTLRTSGWDPMGTGFAPVITDPDLTDNISEIEVFADLDEDGSTNSDGEQMIIRHVNDEVQWRRTNDVTESFRILGVNITNDADGDGAAEPMFVPDDPVSPTRVIVKITAESPARSAETGEFIRYTVTSEVIFRKEL